MLGHTVENGAITMQSVKVINKKFERGRSSYQSIGRCHH
jgi:hypothetical protein